MCLSGGGHLPPRCLPRFPTGSQRRLANQLVPICQPSSSPGSEEGGWPLPCGTAWLSSHDQGSPWGPGGVRKPSPELGPPVGKSSGTYPASPLAAGNATTRVIWVNEQTPQARREGSLPLRHLHHRKKLAATCQGREAGMGRPQPGQLGLVLERREGTSGLGATPWGEGGHGVWAQVQV